MAAEDEDPPEKQPTGEGGKQTKDLDTVTDYVEAREMDASKVQEAMAMLADGDAGEESKADAAREKELASIKVDSAHVTVLMEQYELPKEDAERKLREARGDLVVALTALLDE
mmetsp:Transcript_17678/g.45695  ORF Transcript_17678/g.45695 Transcript_17678/m.45695 type:complete len:113 (-) Transcript_17678:411-749(-)|eukprot:CAMPEP_0119407240 /NCGR_PEP_ID=MMETSP1335-20130426/1218_1 /TAXON_ID=259385 /ORGANISM="Chrysoculter rhomboideus, Strain RCC1486" /LENGTH=112 /DNA_ID=CAMNT_0007431335 /DNA_START=31 /DNA_END=369 /DNA_ORIENTATION=+